MKRAVIIGSGVGGLTSALLLAMHGWEVQVHEQHYRPGGLLHRFFREARPYDTGFHYCGGLGSDDILGSCLRHLGVFDQIRWLPLDEDGFDRLKFPGFEFRVPNGVDAYRERLIETFPEERVGIEGYLADLEEATRHYGLYAFRSVVDPAEFLKWEGQSVEEVVARHTRCRELVAVLTGQNALYGVPAAKAPFGLHAVVMHHFLKGANRIDGGGDRLAKSLVNRLKQLGGTLHLKSRVDQVRVEDGKALGITLASGEQIDADLVVSNMHPRVLLEHLPEGAVRKAYRTRVLDQRVGMGHLGVYVQLDSAADCIGNANVYRLKDFDSDLTFENIRPGHVPFYFATAPAQGLENPSPHHHVVLMLIALDYAKVAPWASSSTGKRPPEYTAYKDSLSQAAVQALCEDFPTLTDKIVRVEASTALTTQHFTRSPEGAMYGHYHEVSQMGRYRPSQFSRVHGLIQVGQSVFAPGVLGSTLSGYYGVGRLLGFERLTDELRVA